MQDYAISTLAWVGDAVFELQVRSQLAADNPSASGTLHRQATRFVSAQGQAVLMECLLEDPGAFPLEEEERNLLRRAHNFHTSSQPRHAELPDYRKATAFEALIGWLWLKGQHSRAIDLIDYVLDSREKAQENDTQKR